MDRVERAQDEAEQQEPARAWLDRFLLELRPFYMVEETVPLEAKWDRFFPFVEVVDGLEGARDEAEEQEPACPREVTSILKIISYKCVLFNPSLHTSPTEVVDRVEGPRDEAEQQEPVGLCYQFYYYQFYQFAAGTCLPTRAHTVSYGVRNGPTGSRGSSGARAR